MEQKPKIIFYTDTPLFGGAEKQMLLLAVELKSQYDISIIHLKSSSNTQLENFAAQNNIKIHNINVKHKNSPFIIGKLSKLIKSLKPDLIHAHNWNPMANKHLFLLKPFLRFKLTVTEHDPFKLNLLKSIYKKLSLKAVDQIICVSEMNASLMKEIYPKSTIKVRAIYNGISLDHHKISDQFRNTLRKKEFNISSINTKVIFSVGTLHSRKGFKYLILAYKNIAELYPETVLIIAGEGPERENLQRLIKNFDLEKKVKLIGFKENISELMQAADLFVLPSLKEAFGLVILEAFQAKLPVIATASGGIPEIIKDKENGLLSKPKNKDNLFKSIRRLLEDEELCKKLIQNSQKTLAEFSSEKMAKKTAQLYQEILKK